MSEHERPLDGLSSDEQALERTLIELGGHLAELRRAEGEVDSDYARTLRAHLLQGEELAPHPTFARRLRADLIRRRGARPLARRRPHIWERWLPVLAVAVVLVAAILTQLPRGTNFKTPTPSRADLLFNLVPTSRSSLASLSPTLSLIQLPPRIPFRGPRHLSSPPLTTTTGGARAYRLAVPVGAVQEARHRFHIDAPIRRVHIAGEPWLVAAEGGTPRHPLHSVAQSLQSGQLIYHDRRNFVLPRSPHPLGASAAVESARGWLKKLGWPGDSMPVRAVRVLPRRPRVRQVVLGWPGVRDATIEAATLWVSPDRSIIEAWVWPPLATSGRVETRSPADAWADVASGKVPLALSGRHAPGSGPLSGSLRHTRPVMILVPGKGDATYLLPAYAFEGQGHTGSATQPRHWVSLAPRQKT